MEQILQVPEAKTDGDQFGEGGARCSLQENPGLNPFAEPGLCLTGLIEIDSYFQHYYGYLLGHWC